MAKGKSKGDVFFNARDWETEVKQLQEEVKKTIKVRKSWEEEAMGLRKDWEREWRGRTMLERGEVKWETEVNRFKYEIYEKKKRNNVLQAENNEFQKEVMCLKKKGGS